MPTGNSERSVTVSIVSHGHTSLLPGLMEDLSRCPEIAEIILTRNIPEPDPGRVLSKRLTVIDNTRPKGFGANHNAAFQRARTPFFLVLNPDVRLCNNPFPVLLSCMNDERVGLCAPAVMSPSGSLEDSARRFPSLRDLAMKACGIHDGRLRFSLGDPPLSVPWVAGMFMLVRGKDFGSLRGFDEGFYLYYEDVDLCARLWRSGRRVMLCPEACVVHAARRASRRDPRHMRWHAASMARYFLKHALRPGLPHLV
ncbi:MAG: glycosyltransferase [Deltaproteobacteria bacterium]